MAKNEILSFAIADGANVLPADEYQKLPARKNGFSAGMARSQELNTGTEYCVATGIDDITFHCTIYCGDQ